MTVIVIYDIFKYGSGYDSMPYYRKYYHVVRPDDPIALEWRPPEDVYKDSLFLQTSNGYSFLEVTEILAWINFFFLGCPSILKINVNTIRAALARWINEECATAIQCNLVSAVEVKNVLVGTIFCGTPNNFITFLVLRNATTYAFLQANHLDLNIVGKVIQSREHLLSALLHSDLKLVTIRVFNEETSGSSSLCGHLCCAIVILSFIVFVITFFTICFMQRSVVGRKSISPSHSLLALQLLRN
ncbi:unnamed protein product [Wuchereria bancrofti]|uniref:Uncharacterized protein n=1 Tax=Wuchereria bancrofti TaxID=6293 RepID=A0A3P7EFZ6_WUCBA|nr:unnamed protein product [Wuchereria bancrofti]